MIASLVFVDQVKQRKQINPDNVDEVPVQAADLDRSVPLGSETSLPGHDEKPEKNTQANNHVQRMQSSHDEVEREKHLRVTRIGELTRMPRDGDVLETKRSAGDVMLFELVFVFDRLDTEEGKTEKHGDPEHGDQQGSAGGLSGPDGEDHGQTTADEYGGIGGAERSVDGFAGGGEVSEVPPAVNQVGAEQAAKKHDFGGEEDPHAQAGGVALLLRLGEVVQQARVIGFAVSVCVNS